MEARLCPVCDVLRPVNVAESFTNGRFLNCRHCGVHFAETQEQDLKSFYREVWSDGHMGLQPYAEKLQAVTDSACLLQLVQRTPRYSWVRNQLATLPSSARILDAGCGEGAMLWIAQQLGHIPFGCDLAEGAVQSASRLVGEDVVRTGTIHELLYEPSSFDFVIALEILEHVPSPRQFVQELAKLLKPTGTLLLTTPNRFRLFAVAKRTLGRPHSNTDYPPHHLTRWSRQSLLNLVDHDFCDIEIGSLPYEATSSFLKLSSLPLHFLTFRRMGQSLCLNAKRK